MAAGEIESTPHGWRWHYELAVVSAVMCDSKIGARANPCFKFLISLSAIGIICPMIMIILKRRLSALAAALFMTTLGCVLLARAADLDQTASPANYLAPVVLKLEQAWPDNHLVNIVFHGHSVPAGYFQTPAVDSFQAYPNLLRLALAKRYTNAVINVIVTAIGGEDSAQGAARFDADVLTHRPDVLFIDYALNDRRIGLAKARAAWVAMIQMALAAHTKVILLTPTPDQSAKLDDPDDPLNRHAEQIRQLAAEYHVGLVDSLARFKAALAAGTPLKNLMAQVNHPNAAGHKLVAEELVKWFPAGPAAARDAYADGRPAAKLRLPATDAGVVLQHGDGPGRCDYLGARDIWVWEKGGTYFMHYDGAGPHAWLACLATSPDLTHWTSRGPVLPLGAAGDDDSASASYGTTYFDGRIWQMFYLGTRRVTPAPNFIPSTPYVTMKAFAATPGGPWTKQPTVVPFRCQPGTYYSDTASPGFIVRQGGEYLMFFSAAQKTDGKLQRTLGIARTKNLDAAWTLDAQPIVPSTEQIENSSLYFEPASQTWFLFSNHVGIENQNEFTDAVWVYWSKDLNRWNPEDKAVVLDGSNCGWSHKCLGLPSVVPSGRRLAVFYDAPGGVSTSHMKRDVGLAWLNLPLTVPVPPLTNAP